MIWPSRGNDARPCKHPGSQPGQEYCAAPSQFSVLHHVQPDPWRAHAATDCCAAHLPAVVEQVDATEPGFVVHVMVLDPAGQQD